MPFLIIGLHYDRHFNDTIIYKNATINILYLMFFAINFCSFLTFHMNALTLSIFILFSVFSIIFSIKNTIFNQLHSNIEEENKSRTHIKNSNRFICSEHCLMDHKAYCVTIHGFISLKSVINLSGLLFQ